MKFLEENCCKLYAWIYCIFWKKNCFEITGKIQIPYTNHSAEIMQKLSHFESSNL